MVRDAIATRRQIIQAADALFYGEGIGSASMDAVAARAGVTKRALYHHFAGKDDLIESAE
jgi:AcrR family transcriptional regulator